MAAIVAAGVLVLFLLAYRFYAKWIGQRIYGDDENLKMPSEELADGVDYVSTPRGILFGHHFTSIAGAAPIVGPCVAAYWGWLPALLWVVLGTIFMGAVHDFGALVMSVRERGRSVADITASVISPRARLMFLSFVLVLVWLVLAVFAMVIAGLFVNLPSSVLPVNMEIVIAIAMGWLLYKKKLPAFWPSVIALAALYLFVWIGVSTPLSFGDLGLSAADQKTTWIVLLLSYSAVASLLPVWLLLQPRDYINSHQLMVGLSLLFLGLFIAQPEIEAPAIRTATEGAPPIFPILFVTVACGAISGFHGLVSSGTTSKQLSSLRHARSIGYGSMLGEGTLALASTMAAVAGIGLVGACTLPGQGPVTDLSWHQYYDTWAHAGANKATAFVLGGAAFLQTVGLSEEVARTLMAVLVISFAATTLDTATRIQRFIVAEMGAALRLPTLEKPIVGTLIAVLPAAALALWETPVAGTDTTREVGWVLWPVFGASNQMLAALTLMVLALYFGMRKKPVWPLLVPMLFVTTITIVALLAKWGTFAAAENWPLVTFTTLLLALIGWMLVEGLLTVRRLKQNPPSESGKAD